MIAQGPWHPLAGVRQHITCRHSGSRIDHFPNQEDHGLFDREGPRHNGLVCTLHNLGENNAEKVAWMFQLTWDQPLSDELQQLWKTWTSELPLVTSQPIDRRYSLNNQQILSQSLHGFADTSQDAYRAVVYLLRQYGDSTITASIVIAKARVMPLKTMTIPRAELTAAYLLAKLLRHISNRLQINDITAWSDSSVTLCWLRKSPSALKTFVSNRVKQINKLLPDVQWRHVSSQSNPADSLSSTSSLWWHGPRWLTTPQFQQPEELPEIRSVILLATTKPEEDFWECYSSHLVHLRMGEKIHYELQTQVRSTQSSVYHISRFSVVLHLYSINVSCIYCSFVSVIT